MKVLVDKKPPKVTFSTELPNETVVEFNRFVETLGHTKWKAIRGAFRLFQWAPADLRELLMKGDASAVQEWFQKAQRALVQIQVQQFVDQRLQERQGTRRGGRRKAGSESDR